MQKQLEKIRKGQIEPIYFIHGTDSYLMNLFKQTLIEMVVPAEERDLNVSTYNLQEVSLSQALADAMSIPFLSERKLVMIDSPTFLTAEKSKTVTDTELSDLTTYLKSPNAETVLAIFAPYESLDNRKKINKAIQKAAVTILVNPLAVKETQAFVKDSIQANGYTIDRDVLGLLLDRTHYQLALTMQELDKLYLSRMVERRIQREDVEELVAKSLENNIFELVEKVLDKKSQAALLIYRDLILQKEEPIKLTSLLLSQVRLMLQVKLLQARGYQQSDMAKQLKQHPYRIQLAVGKTQAYSLDYFKQIYQILADLDFGLKTSYVDKHLLMEMALLKIMH